MLYRPRWKFFSNVCNKSEVTDTCVLIFFHQHGAEGVSVFLGMLITFNPPLVPSTSYLICILSRLCPVHASHMTRVSPVHVPWISRGCLVQIRCLTGNTRKNHVLLQFSRHQKKNKVFFIRQIDCPVLFYF